MIRKSVALAGLLVLAFSALAQAGTYSIDPAHSSVSFLARHMVVTKVRGHFDTFEGSVQFEEGKPESWRVTATIDANSVNTGVEKRDGHLRSPDFLDVAKYPEISFKSTGVSTHKGGGWVLNGDLTLHGVTKPISLDLEYNGSIQDPYGNTRAGFTATGALSRKDYGLTWNNLLETGGAVVSDEIQIEIEVEGILQK